MTTLLGVHEPQHSLAGTKTRWSQVAVSRPFVGGIRSPQDMIPPFRNACRESWEAGITPVVSFKPHVGDVAAGRWDARLQALGEWLRTQPPTMVIPWHEPEDDMSGPTFRGMFNRVAGFLKSEKVQVGYASNTYRWRYGSETSNPANWVVDADFYGADVYSGNSFPLATVEDHPGFQRWLNAYIRDTVKAETWWLTERGFQGNAVQRATVIRDEAEYLVANSGCAGYIYWNSPGAEQDLRWVLDQTHGEPALRDFLTRLGGQTLPLPDRYQEGYDDGYAAGYYESKEDAVAAIQGLQP